MDDEGHVGAFMLGEEAKVHCVSVWAHRFFARPLFDEISEDDDGTPIGVLVGACADEVNGLCVQISFFAEFAQGGFFGVFSKFDKSAGESPLAFAGFDCALDEE